MKNGIPDQLPVLFNLSFTWDSFATSLKTSKVTPIYKKNSKHKCSSYRPISLLSNIDKIFERILYNYLYKFFEENKLICNPQFGFRQNHSTTHTLIHLTGKICEQLDSGKFGCGFLLIFRKLLILLITQFLPKSEITMVLEERQIFGFSLTLKTEHNLSLLKVSIKSLKKLITVSPKGQY